MTWKRHKRTETCSLPAQNEHRTYCSVLIYIYIYGILTSCTRDLGKRFYFMTRKEHIKSVYSSTSFSHLFSATAVPKFLSIMLLCWLINSVWCFLDNFELTADNKCRYISGHISLGSEKNTNEKTLGDLEMYIYIYIYILRRIHTYKATYLGLKYKRE